MVDLPPISGSDPRDSQEITLPHGNVVTYREVYDSYLEVEQEIRRSKDSMEEKYDLPFSQETVTSAEALFAHAPHYLLPLNNQPITVLRAIQ